MHQEAAELFDLESQAAEAEALLEQDLVTARAAAEQASFHLAQLQAAAGKAGPDEAAACVCREVSQLAPPRFEEEPARAAVLSARRHALEQRRAAGQAFRAAVEAFRRRTAELELRITHEAQQLDKVQRRAEVKKAAPPPPPRRESPRVAMCTQVDLDSDSNFYGGFSTNLSEGGLFIATVSTPPRGTVVELTFTLPGGAPIKARGVVRWTREVNDALPEMMPGAGVQFVELAPEAAATISQFVMKRDPLFYVD